MRMTLAVLVMAFVLLGCGPRKPGPEPEQVYFWKVKTSTLEFGECTDTASFRDQINPINLTDNSFIVYKVAKDLKTATSQDCDNFNVSTCKESTAPIVFTIAGTELTFAQESKAPIGMTGCSLQQAETWTFTDQGLKFSMEIANTLSLVDGTTACDNVEANEKLKSSNMKGVAGCIVTWKLTGDLR